MTNHKRDTQSKVAGAEFVAVASTEAALAAASASASRPTSINRRIASALLTVGALTVLAKVAVTAKEVALASYFGPSQITDAYLVALLAPAYVTAVIASSVTSAVVPTYVEMRETQGPPEARRLAQSIVFGCLVLTGSVAAVLWASGGTVLQMLGPGLQTETRLLAGNLYYLLLPSLIFSGLAATYGAFLNAVDRYAVGALAPTVAPLIPALTLFLLSADIKVVAAATTLGYFAEAVVLAVCAARAGIGVLPGVHGSREALRRVGKQYASIVVGASLISSTLLVDQAMATTLGAGSVSVLVYASKIPSFLLAVGAVSISAAVLPQFSRLVARGDWAQIRKTLRTWWLLIALVSAPATLLLAASSEVLVGLVFEHGSFTRTDSAAVTATQMMFLLQVPFYLVSILIVRLISALHANIYLLAGAVFSVIMNVALNLLLMPIFGVGGIALSTSIVYAMTCGILTFSLRRILRTREQAAT